jgi:DNA processing protein
MRNTVMSAFSMATVIVQASEKSGTKHQARSAIAHGRPIIITDTVASTTTWGRKLAEGRLLDVTVVSTLEEAVCAAIDKSQPTQVVQPSSVEMAAAW